MIINCQLNCINLETVTIPTAAVMDIRDALGSIFLTNLESSWQVFDVSTFRKRWPTLYPVGPEQSGMISSLLVSTGQPSGWHHFCALWSY